jgi:hypothetical protein
MNENFYFMKKTKTPKKEQKGFFVSKTNQKKKSLLYFFFFKMVHIFHISFYRSQTTYGIRDYSDNQNNRRL